MKLPTLKSKVDRGEIDTVITVFPDVFGRLVGKRFTGDFFLKEVASRGTHGCNYLLTVNIEMDPMDGFKLANWEQGFGDFELQPDLETLRELPWPPGTAMVLCDLLHHDHSPVQESPRSVLRRQVAALQRRGFKSYVASELEFFLFNQSFHDAFKSEYRKLVPSSDYRIDYHTMQQTQEELLL